MTITSTVYPTLSSLVPPLPPLSSPSPSPSVILQDLMRMFNDSQSFYFSDTADLTRALQEQGDSEQLLHWWRKVQSPRLQMCVLSVWTCAGANKSVYFLLFVSLFSFIFFRLMRDSSGIELCFMISLERIMM